MNRSIRLPVFFGIFTGLVVAYSSIATGTTVKPMKHTSKGAMQTNCKNSGGNYYSNDRGGYGCTAKDGSWTLECGNKGQCVSINWQSRTGEQKPGKPPVTGILNNSPGMAAQGPGGTGKPATPSAPPPPSFR
jgi:hypothetical protein